MDDLGVPRGGGFDWPAKECLALRFESLCEEGRALDYRRQLLQGRIDLILAELAGRDTAALPPEELARVLLGEVPARGAAMDTATDPVRDLP
jgi:hypothetical protein